MKDERSEKLSGLQFHLLSWRRLTGQKERYTGRNLELYLRRAKFELPANFWYRSQEAVIYPNVEISEIKFNSS